MSEPTPSGGANVLGVIGLVLYAATAILYLASGLMVPIPGLLVLWAIWIAGIALLIWVWRKWRPYTPLVAVAALVLWWVYLYLGETLFGWTA